MGLYRWVSRHEYVAPDGAALRIAAIDPKVRKRVALMVEDCAESVVVAYFQDEEVARDIADRFFGGTVTP